MKKLFRYLNIATLFIALSAVFASCSDKNDVGDGNIGLNIKVFAPTSVAPGYPMTINGSGFNDVKQIIFPGDIVVENFEIVTNEMIRVKAPEGLTQGGTIKVRTESGETAESRLPLTVGGTVITGVSVEEGDVIKGNELLTIYGKDMQFITGADFLDQDSLPIYVEAAKFYRLAPGRAVIQVPSKVLTGSFNVKLYLCDGRVLEAPMVAFETATTGGHWEKTQRFLWENTDKTPVPAWGGLFRIGLAGHDGGNECIATLDEASWEAIKEGTVFFLYEGNEASNVRITTGWWSAAYGGNEHNCIDLSEDGPQAGTRVIELDIKKDHNIYDLIDDQHLLFTGSDYTPLGIYVEEDVWIEGEGGHIETERISLWKNGVQSTIPAPSWSGEGRFACINNSSGEETYAFTEEEWEIIRNEEFCVAIEAIDNPNVRVTSGWWSSDYGGKEYNCFEIAEPIGNDQYVLHLKLSNYPELQDLVDVQHLLFTGSGYKVLEIYQEKEIWVDGDNSAAEPIVLWTNDGSNGAVSWNGVYRFSNEQTVSGEQIHAFTMEEWEIIKNGTFYVEFEGNAGSNLRITTGWWTGAYGGAEHNCIDMAEDLGGGKMLIKINIKEDGNLYDNLDAQHFLLTGDAYTPLRIYYYK